MLPSSPVAPKMPKPMLRGGEKATKDLTGALAMFLIKEQRAVFLVFLPFLDMPLNVHGHHMILL